MDDAERYRLLGTYHTPRFHYGRKVLCEVRGEVIVTDMTDAPIPWPIGEGGRDRHSLIVFKGLARAVRRESNQAVAHWWGIDPQTVSKWRRLLGVGIATPGTSRLHRETIEETGEAMRALGVLKARDPERRAKIAAARRGKPRPPHVIEAMAEARRGSHHSDEARRKMGQTHRRRGTLVPGTIPWTAEENDAVRTLTVDEAVARTGRSQSAVYKRRRVLQVPDGRKRD